MTIIYLSGIIIGVVLIGIEIVKVFGQRRGAQQFTEGRLRVYSSPNASSPHKSLSDEVMRLMAKAPKWTPATDESGNPTKTMFMLPVKFELR